MEAPIRMGKITILGDVDYVTLLGLGISYVRHVYVYMCWGFKNKLKVLFVQRMMFSLLFS